MFTSRLLPDTLEVIYPLYHLPSRLHGGEHACRTGDGFSSQNLLVLQHGFEPKGPSTVLSVWGSLRRKQFQVTIATVTVSHGVSLPVATSARPSYYHASLPSLLPSLPPGGISQTSREAHIRMDSFSPSPLPPPSLSLSF